MFTLLIILYFSIVGGLFYRLFIAVPSEPVVEKEPVFERVQELAMELTPEPVKSKSISNEAADIHVG